LAEEDREEIEEEDDDEEVEELEVEEEDDDEEEKEEEEEEDEESLDVSELSESLSTFLCCAIISFGAIFKCSRSSSVNPPKPMDVK